MMHRRVLRQPGQDFAVAQSKSLVHTNGLVCWHSQNMRKKRGGQCLPASVTSTVALQILQVHNQQSLCVILIKPLLLEVTTPRGWSNLFILIPLHAKWTQLANVTIVSLASGIECRMPLCYRNLILFSNEKENICLRFFVLVPHCC